MAKLHCILIILASLFCSPLIGITIAITAKLAIEGRVYCDTCRAGFETTLTRYIAGSKVKLECRNFETGEVETSVEGVTDAAGTYQLGVKRKDDEQDICEVALMESSDPACSEKPRGRDRARIILGDEDDSDGAVRYATPLGFLAGSSAPLPPECGVILKKYALGGEEEDWIV